MASAIGYRNTHSSPFQALRPHTAADTVTRPRLLRLLEQGASLTLVVAPAGYGKTTLIADWLETCDLPSAWVTFDAEVGDLHHFLTYLLPGVAAGLPPSAGEVLQELLAARTLPPFAVVAEILRQELATVEQEFVLVLDDFQFVAAPEAHALLAELLRLPTTPLRLIIATRHDPPLPLVRLRASGRLVEIRSRDLSFSAAEAEQFLQDSLDAPLSAAEIDDLVRGAEGWAASLRLAQLYLRQEQGFASLARALEVGARHAREFLADEVFAGLPPAIQTFLMETAILERLSARVCAALSDGGDVAAAQANLLWLVANGVFTSPIDDAQEWFRCHALLRQFAGQQLREHCDDAHVAMLHRRASRWFAAAGSTEDAIRHALAAGDVADAVNTFAPVRHALMKTAQWMELSHLLHLFSPQQIEREPELMLVQAWIARSQNNVTLLQASVQLASALLNGRDDGRTTEADALHRTASLQGEVAALQGHLCYWGADMAGVVAHTRRSLALLPRTAEFARGFAVLFCVTGCQATGELAAAYALLDRYAEELNPEDYIEQLHWMTCRIVPYALEGDLASSAATADAMLQLGAGRPWTEPMGIAHHFRAVVHYWRNELAEIEPLALAVLTHRYQSTPRYVVQTACILALAYQAQGRTAEATAIAAAELLSIETNGVAEMRPYLHALQADLALRQGNVDAAAALLRETVQMPLLTTQFHYTPHLVVLRLYLQQNTTASLDAAGELIERMERFWAAIGHAQLLLELLVHKALYWQARGNQAAALETLAQAARQAQPHGNIRIFADLGMPIDGLLAKLQQTGVAPLLVAAARAAIAAEAPHPASAAPPTSSPSALADDLAVLLTFREQEVLRLLGEHLTNQEIAAKLCISTETVKRHSISIFRKLDVKNRRAAALFARQLAPV
jgi:LuxR family maltose regulon positive regulatory protein